MQNGYGFTGGYRFERYWKQDKNCIYKGEELK